MLLRNIDMQTVREHYDRREAVRRQLLSPLDRNDADGYARLAVGLSDDAGHYSAAEHRLGARIIANNSSLAVLILGRDLVRRSTA